MDGVPYANAPIACAPPIRAISFTPRISAAASSAGLGFGQATTMAVNTGDLRRDRGHQQCGKSEKRPPGM